MPDWMEPFAHTIHAAKKYVVSNTLERVDWNAELVRGDLRTAVQHLERQLVSRKVLGTGAVVLRYRGPSIAGSRAAIDPMHAPPECAAADAAGVAP